ncbi:hypothetical protein BVG19_g4800 [[Candida] boidinii]|nr:hypothetical protein BVG19_g4800 [[Candida] boidinii]OWB51953.1 hypothetical protein B5S27_g3524 [[Candida] boidinii]
MSYYNSDYNNYATSNSPSQIQQQQQQQQQLQSAVGGSPLPGYTTNLNMTSSTDQKQQSFNLQQQPFNLQQQQPFNYQQQQQQRLNSPIINNYISLSNYNTNQNNSNSLISSSASSSISSSSGYQPLSLSSTNTSINSLASNNNNTNTNNNSSSNLSINTRARFMCSKGFELEDDIEFCPDIQLNIIASNNNNNNNGKFNPYTSITFSPNGSAILPATPTMDHSSLSPVDLNPSDILSKTTGTNNTTATTTATTTTATTTTTTPTNELIRPSSPSPKNFTPRVKKILEIVNPHTGLRVGSPVLRNSTLVNNANNTNNNSTRSATPSA